MFPYCGNSFWHYDSASSSRAYRERKLEFLKWMRDELEAKLAGVNASIETVERQINQRDNPSV